MMAKLDLDDFIQLVKIAPSPGALWGLVESYSKVLDIRMVSYHNVEVQVYENSKRGIIEFGVPADFRRQYSQEHLYLDDPIPGLAARCVEPFYWDDSPNLMDMSDRQLAYLEQIKEMRLCNGVGLQVFGPQSRNALIGIGFEWNKPRLSPKELSELHFACQIAHLRFCALIDAPKSPYAPLAPRELEVLRWIARGKTNTVIAEIMGISPHTVDTITRRMFDKLDVTDRTRAAVRGIGAGLLTQSGDNLI